PPPASTGTASRAIWDFRKAAAWQPPAVSVVTRACYGRHGMHRIDSRSRPMPASVMYHDGNRKLQDRFDRRRISDRLGEKLKRKELSGDATAFIEGLPYFFLATADADGQPDCSFKGGPPGFVRVTGTSEIAFPDYDGNG